jgi:hypothetical protein
MSDKDYQSFSEFYPFYLSQHANVVCRRLHLVSSTLVLLLLGWLILNAQWVWLPSVLVVGYGFAWVGHFFFEKNRPATFTYPLYSFMGDWVMWFDCLTGRQKI